MGSPSNLIPDEVPDEVVFEILARLPAKSLMRFRCVCKDWHSLIEHDQAFATSVFNTSKPRFLVAIFDQNLKGHQIFLVDGDGEPAFYFLSLHRSNFLYDDQCFSNSIDGLLCFLNANQVIICNPAIRQTAMLPPTGFYQGNISFDNNHIMYFSRIFLGYDSNTRSYKVLIIHISMADLMVCGFEMLTLGIQPLSWRRLEGLWGYHIKARDYSPDPVVNGAVHWEGITKEDEKEVVVVAFDIGEERFEVIPLPTGLTNLFYIGKHNGQLFVVNVNPRSDNEELS